jgi:hypothetical protein
LESRGCSWNDSGRFKLSRHVAQTHNSPRLESSDLVNVPVEEVMRLRVGNVEQFSRLRDVTGDALVDRDANLVAFLKYVKRVQNESSLRYYSARVNF